MKLIYLSTANLQDRLFIKDFVHNLKTKTPMLILHEAFGGTLRDTTFVTKRISALLSECLVHNHAFSAAQRDFFYQKDGELQVAKEKIDPLFAHIHVVILGPIVKVNGEEMLFDAKKMVLAVKNAYNIEEVILFPDNPLSPLGSKKSSISSEEDLEKLLKLYEEEKAALQRGYEMRTARICTPVNYCM